MAKKRVHFKSLKHAASQLPEMIGQDTKQVIEAFSEVVLSDLAKQCIGRTPVGPDDEAARRVQTKGSPAYGHMKNRWFIMPAKGFGKFPATRPVRFKAGKAWRLVNDAAHARVIEMGRGSSKPSKTKTGKTITREIGSPRAPSGIAGPSILRQQATLEKLRSRAINKAEAR